MSGRNGQGEIVGIDRIDEYAGLRRELEIGVCLAPTRAGAAAAAKALAAFLDEDPAVPVRLAGLTCDSSRVLITIAVTLGAIDDIKVAGPGSRAGVLLLQRIVDDLAGYDPAFVTLPEPSSAEARLAAHVVAHADRGRATVLTAVKQLATIG
jgi:hypothetical protein